MQKSKAKIALILLRIVLLSVAVFFTPGLFVQPYYVSSSGMEPDLQKGNRIAVRLWHGSIDGQRRGQIIAFKRPEKRIGISRVIGIAGDYVDAQQGKVVASSTEATTKVTPDCVFIFGDNPGSSHFSELIDTSQIIGPVWFRFWPNARFF